MKPLLDWARQAHQHGDLEQAEQLCRQIIHATPPPAELWLAWFQLGAVRRDRNQHAEAAAAFREAALLQPGAWHAHNGLGVALSALGEPAEAEMNFRRALDLEPAAGDVSANLANVLWSQGKLDEAESAFRQALHLQPADVRLH